MSWKLKWHPEGRPEHPQPGDCWPEPSYLKSPSSLSRQYHEQNSARPPLMVCFPDGNQFCVDAGFRDGSGWDVRGDVSNLTVTPSIRHFDAPGRPGYHGYITNGVITDDCEGKRFPQE